MITLTTVAVTSLVLLLLVMIWHMVGQSHEIRMLKFDINKLVDDKISLGQLDVWWYGDHNPWTFRGCNDRSGALATVMARTEMLAKHQGVQFSYTVPQKSEMILVPVDPEVKQ